MWCKIKQNLSNYGHLRQSIRGLTHNFEVSVCCVVVHHRLSRAGVATFVPNLDVLYSQVTAAIITLNHRKIKDDGKEKGRMKRVRQSCTYSSFADNTSKVSSGCKRPVRV